MNFGQMKTSFNDVLTHNKIPFYLNSFAEAISWSEMFLATSLPLSAIHNLVRVVNVDPPDSDPRSVPLPSGALKIESVRMALERAADGTPRYLQCTEVSPDRYLAEVQYTDDIVFAIFNGAINVSPSPAASGTVGAIEVVYRAAPTKYLSSSHSSVTGNIVSVLDGLAQPRVYSTATDGSTWLSLGLDESKMIGATATFVYGSYVFYSRIDRAWTVVDDGGPGVDVSYLHLEDGYPTGQAGADLTNVIVGEKEGNSSGVGVYLSDLALPAINESWHGVMFDLAIARYLMSRVPNVAQGYLQLALAELKQVGVQVPSEFGGNM